VTGLVASQCVIPCAFALIELNRDDLRREPLEHRKAARAKVIAPAAPALQFNEHIEEDGATVFRARLQDRAEAPPVRSWSVRLYPIEG
jgi:ATP-dependent DNA ligase